MSSLYIITSDIHEKAGQYKVGIHSGEVDALFKRYRTPIPTVSLRLFVSMGDGKAKNIEDKIKLAFEKYRITGTGGNDSEFYQTSLGSLYAFISPLLTESAPSSLANEDEKVQEQLMLVKKAMEPIKFQLEQMETIISPNRWISSYGDLLREITLEKEAFASGQFKGERLLTIRKMLMNILTAYNPGQSVANLYFGDSVVQGLRLITKCMDDVNRIQSGTFKKVPQIVEIKLVGTDKDDIIYRRFVFFFGCRNSYLERHWKQILKIQPQYWHFVRDCGIDETLSPAKIVAKHLKRPGVVKVKGKKAKSTVKMDTKHAESNMIDLMLKPGAYTEAIQNLHRVKNPLSSD